MTVLRPLLIAAGLIVIWQSIIVITGVQFFILPSPARVASALVDRHDVIAVHALITLSEILLSLAGQYSWNGKRVNYGILPIGSPMAHAVLVISQAVPVFALAPILVLWLGYGLGSKVAMATLIIYFPVTAAFYDGLRRTNLGHLELARTMGASRWSILRHIRLPAALPSLASGMRVAAAVAPIGAVVGEWVGSSGGLGYLMLHANGRMQIDVMFAALFVLAVIAIALYFLVDAVMRRLVHWQPETKPSND